jgi:hypothetical protein
LKADDDDDVGWMDVWEFNPEVVIALAKASASWGGIILAEGFHDWGLVGRAPFELYPGICLTTEEKHGQPQSGSER